MNKRQILENEYSRAFDGVELLKKHAPLIGISGNFRDGDCTLAAGYYRSLVEAGATPVIIPPYSDIELLVSLVKKLDGVVLSGGADIDPDYLEELPIDGIDINPERDKPELILIKLLIDRHVPILGICRGMQMLSAALGGKLYQDIYTQHNVDCICHSQKIARGLTSHSVNIQKDTLLYSIMNTDCLDVNSFHHQAVKSVPKGFVVSAVAQDGIIEAMESVDYQPILGVQWHPECMLAEGNKIMMPLFEWLVNEAALYSRAKKFHSSYLTLDSHCDSPMFFDCGAHFNVKNPGIEVEYAYVGEDSPDGSATFSYNPLVDIHKMDEGGLDAVFMVAYLRQLERDADSLKAATAKADRILNLIVERISECNGKAAIAILPDQLYQNKSAGVKSVVLGIENGYAIAKDISNIAKYRDKGVAYMTLCHNGDNDICDSARGNIEHNGLSSFGRDVVAEMNRVGMMIDLSHASEKTFYDVLECSNVPVICSHSSSRLLCDHPRNLTDNQMRALAAKGGVAQVCLYSGFLKKGGGATVDDAVKHIVHMVDVMGIDSVGIGSDFDGGGGLPGLEDASRFNSLTRRLMREGFSDDDLSKIWGRNFIRVWKQIIKQ
mgnify:FL=1